MLGDNIRPPLKESWEIKLVPNATIYQLCVTIEFLGPDDKKSTITILTFTSWDDCLILLIYCYAIKPLLTALSSTAFMLFFLSKSTFCTFFFSLLNSTLTFFGI
jgi:hypothetical protein